MEERKAKLKLQIKIEGKTYEVEVDIVEEEEIPPPVSYGSYQSPSATSQSTAFLSPKRASLKKRDAADEKVYLSPVTGIVIKLHIKVGQLVEANELMMVLEAMKMETSITAHRPGKVKSVSVAPGNSVKVNQILVEFE
jgi:methylmalonyl-CoA carboxyltransferase small subunit